MNKTISIIVPIYNAEKTLDKCVSSITGQTYAHLEIILINDGSTDNSLYLCNSYKAEDERIKVIDKENTGVSDTRNFGLDIATGDYIMFVDSDDYIDSATCEKMLNIAVEEDCALTRCGFNKVTQFGIEKIHEAFAEKAFVEKDLDCFFIKENSVTATCWGMLIRNDLIRNIRFNKDVKIWEDMLFCMQLIEKSDKCSYLNEPLYYYDVTDNNANYTKYFKAKYIRDYYFLSEEIKKINKLDSKLVNSVCFYNYINICKSFIYDDSITAINEYLNENELKTLNNETNYRCFIELNSNKKTRVFAYLAYKRRFGLLKAMQRLIDLRK